MPSAAASRFMLHAVLVCIFLVSNGNAAYLEISPRDFVESVTQTVFISCSPDGSLANAREILLMEIAKDGDTPITNVRPANPVKINDDLPTIHFAAEGLIDNSDIPDSFLNLTISYPDKDDAGSYTCLMSYIDKSGLLQQAKAAGDLKVTDVHDRFNDSTERRLDAFETALNNLLGRIKGLEQQNNELQIVINNQSNQIGLLKDRVHFSAAFSAAILAKQDISTGQTLVFPDVSLNEGNAYNDTSGVFTAPRAGLYVFHLVMEIGQEGALGEITLRSGKEDLVKMYTQDAEFGDQGAITGVTQLSQGDQVSVYIYLAANGPKALGEKLCVFSGFMVRAT